MARTLRVLVATALLTSLVLAGCSSKPQNDASTTGPTPMHRVRLDPPTNITFAPAIVLGQVNGGAEPSIAAGPAASFVVTPLAMWRSQDGGATWKDLGTHPCSNNLPACPSPRLQSSNYPVRGGGDADIYIGPDNHVHWLGLADHPTASTQNQIPYQQSTDNGTTWSPVMNLANAKLQAEPSGAGTSSNSTDREWITGRADGTLFAAWRHFPPSGGTAKIVMKASYDGGHTWTELRNVADDTRQGGIDVDPTSNAIALAYDLNGVVSVARSFDDGKTWNHTVAVRDAAQGHVFPVAAYDTNGTLYLIYSHDKDGSPVPDGTPVASRPFETPSVYMQVSHDKGKTFGAPVQVNKPGTTAWFPWIAAGSAGRIVVTWYQNDEGYPRQVGGNVYVMAATSLDADMSGPRFAVQRATPSPVHVGPECRENPGVCTRSLLDFFEVAIHPKGYAMMTWAADTYPVPGDQVVTSRMVSGPNLWGH